MTAEALTQDPPPPSVSDELLADAWTLFDAFNDPALVRPSIPILYFGDAQGYSQSPMRIVTVGFNPSRLEFPVADRFQRFPAAEPSRGNPRLAPSYRAALDSYFRQHPYMAWFGSYEAILNGADASYLQGARSIALHTDICSPLATDPTWNRLTVAQQKELESGGTDLWHKLISQLQPHLIIASVAAHHLAKIRFQRVASPSLLWTVDRMRPFPVYRQQLGLGDPNRSLLVWGRPVNLPFGSVSRADRVRIGAAAAEVLARG